MYEKILKPTKEHIYDNCRFTSNTSEQNRKNCNVIDIEYLLVMLVLQQQNNYDIYIYIFNSIELSFLFSSKYELLISVLNRHATAHTFFLFLSPFYLYYRK